MRGAELEAAPPARGAVPWPRGLGRLWDVPFDAHAISALDGVRAVAAALVFLVHYQAAFGSLLGPTAGAAYRAGEYTAAVGYHGVSVFFVLSGYLIYGSLIARPVPLARYLRRRVRRIYPTFLVVLALYLALSVAFPDRSKLPDDGALAYVLANALLLPGVFPVRPIVTVSWSLSFEVAFYVLIALVVVGLRMRAWRPRWRLAAWGLVALAWAAGGAAAQAWVRSFILFLPGIVIAELAAFRRVRDWTARVPLAVTGALLAAALLAQPLLGGEFLSARITSAVFAPQALSTLSLSFAVGLLLLREIARRDAGGALSRAPLRRMGVASYSFYLIHGLTINAAAEGLAWAGAWPALGRAGVLAYLLLLPPVFAAALVAGFTLFRTVEQPLSLPQPAGAAGRENVKLARTGSEG